MPEELDSDAIIAQLQKENEVLREKLAKIKLQAPWLRLLSWYNVRQLLQNPYFIVGYIVGALFALFFCFSGFEKGV